MNEQAWDLRGWWKRWRANRPGPKFDLAARIVVADTERAAGDALLARWSADLEGLDRMWLHGDKSMRA